MVDLIAWNVPGGRVLDKDLESVFRQWNPDCVIHRDRWKPCERFPEADHQLCWAHIRRYLQALLAVPSETAVQPAMLKLASDRAFALWRAFLAGTLPRIQLARRMRPIREEVWVRLGLILRDRKSTRKGRALAEDLLRQGACLWTYLRRKGAFPTNYGAERSLRQAVIWRKITYGARFPSGCAFVSSILTILGSAKARPSSFLSDPEVRQLHWARVQRAQRTGGATGGTN